MMIYFHCCGTSPSLQKETTISSSLRRRAGSLLRVILNICHGAVRMRLSFPSPIVIGMKWVCATQEASEAENSSNAETAGTKDDDPRTDNDLEGYFLVPPNEAKKLCPSRRTDTFFVELLGLCG